jgi:hypothetical protein
VIQANGLKLGSVFCIHIKNDATILVMADHVCECSHCDCKVKFDCNESGCLCCSTTICYLDWSNH